MKIIAAGLLALALTLAACNRDPAGKDGLTGAQRQQIDNAAAMVEDNQVYDTSPDSLTLNANAGDAAGANSAAPPGSNVSGSANSAATANVQR